MSKKSFPRFFLLFFLFCLRLNSTSLNKEIWSAIELELSSWDSVRGVWLSNSIIALANRTPLPERKFQEDFTPFEMMKLVTTEKQQRIHQQIGRTNDFEGLNETKYILIVKSFVEKIKCSVLIGRSFGDPHLSTFDKGNYSFQTVGEFVLMKMKNSEIEIQCRQQPQNENFSFNTAIAINLAGDKIGLYGSESPDRNSALRINGRSYTEGSAFALPHGGTIRVKGEQYTFSSPYGETVTAELRNWRGGFRFMNINVQIFSCYTMELGGLLGNANNDADDDFITRSRMPQVSYSAIFGNSLLSKLTAQAERQYLTFLANEFADLWRVTNESTLFEYSSGKNTLSYTDKTFPRAHLTLADLTPAQQTRARKKCENDGVVGEDLRGCVFDQAFLEVDPAPRAPVPDFTKGAFLGRTELPSPEKITVIPKLLKNNILKPEKFVSPKHNKASNFLNGIFPKKNTGSILNSTPRGNITPGLINNGGSAQPLNKGNGK